MLCSSLWSQLRGGSDFRAPSYPLKHMVGLSSMAISLAFYDSIMALAFSGRIEQNIGILIHSMQSWKRKKAPYQRASSQTWKQPVLACFFILLTLVLAVMLYPQPWNRAMDWVNASVKLPTGWAKIESSPFRLGLDLQGGAHLVYEADMKEIPQTDREDALEGVRDVIEQRVNAFGVSEPLVQTTIKNDHHRVIVELAGVLDVQQAVAQIGETPILEFKEQNTEIDREPTPEEREQLAQRNATERDAANEVLRRARSGEDFDTLVTEKSGETPAAATAQNETYGAIVKAITASGARPGSVLSRLVQTDQGLSIVKYLEKTTTPRMFLSHILVCFEGSTRCENPIPEIEASIKINDIKSQATIENFSELAKQYSQDAGTAANGGDLGVVEPGAFVPTFELAAAALPVGNISDVVRTEFGYHLIYKKTEEKVPAYRFAHIPMPLSTIEDIVAPSTPWKNTALSGKHLKRSQVEFDPNTNQPFVGLQFNGEGADLFAELTASHVGKPIAIFLDGNPISIPTVQEAIYGGKAVISGDFTLEEAKTLAQRLNAGALPVPIHLESQQTVGPTLGKESLDKSMKAGLIGLALVALFMIAVYRVSGVLAVLALVLYGLLNLWIYKVFDVTMTLSGIAGFVLSLGMAVDANVLIFERMRDERRQGRDLKTAAEEGVKRAWAAIRDGNFTTLIASVILYTFTSSFIRGFALTLTVGVLLSMFSAIIVTRSYMQIAMRRASWRKDALFSVRGPQS